MPKAKKTTEETIKITGEKVVGKVKELVKEGNVRKIIIEDKNGKEIAAFSLTIGLVGAVIAPILAAIGALAALLTECTIKVIREK